MQGADIVGAVSVYNQTAGAVRLFTAAAGGNMRVARIGYGYFNLTGGLFQMSNNGAVSRFNLNESNAAAVGVGYVGGTGVLNLAYSGTTSVSSFRINGVSQATGRWGRVGSIAELGAQFESSRITGPGMMSMTGCGTDHAKPMRLSMSLWVF